MDRKYPQGERLLQKPVAAAAHDLPGLPFDAVAAGKEHLHPRVDALELVEDLAAAHFRHDHVQDHGVDSGGRWV